MSSPCLRLRPLRAEDERAALGAHADLVAADDFPFLLDHRPDEPWNSYLARLEAQRRGISLFNGWVPATFLVAVVEDRLVGALLTCSESNFGSRRVIELCGGVLESVVSHPSDGSPVRRYWIW